MNLQEIARRCGLSVRQIRYVLDHQVLPGQPYVQHKGERGQPRVVTEFEAFGIAIAAHLLNAGIRRANVAYAIQELATMAPERKKHPNDLLLLDAFQSRKPAKLRIGSNGGVRSMTLGESVHAGSAATEDVVVVEIDLAAVRQQLLG